MCSSMVHCTGGSERVFQSSDIHACACSYMLITISTGTAPSNKLWYMETAQLPKKPDGGLDMSSYDLRSGSAFSSIAGHTTRPQFSHV